MTIPKKYMLLFAFIAIAASVSVYAVFPLHQKTVFIACDQQGMAYMPMSEKVSLPWVMTDSGPLRGDNPRASLGRQMTCDEARTALHLRP